VEEEDKIIKARKARKAGNRRGTAVPCPDYDQFIILNGAPCIFENKWFFLTILKTVRHAYTDKDRYSSVWLNEVDLDTLEKQQLSTAVKKSLRKTTGR
jgi:hypothetical protein